MTGETQSSVGNQTCVGHMQGQHLALYYSAGPTQSNIALCPDFSCHRYQPRAPCLARAPGKGSHTFPEGDRKLHNGREQRSPQIFQVQRGEGNQKSGQCQQSHPPTTCLLFPHNPGQQVSYREAHVCELSGEPVQGPGLVLLARCFQALEEEQQERPQLCKLPTPGIGRLGEGSAWGR